ncbi:MAG: hypothetical protein WDO17_24365 [Alphaproteobacteria bacterium]
MRNWFEHLDDTPGVARLFDTVLIRLEPLVALLKPLVMQFATKLKDSLIGAAITAVVAALGAIFGRIVGLF